MYYIVSYSPVSYGTYEFPQWAEIMGLLISFSSMIWVPAYAIYYLLSQPGTFREVSFENRITCAKIGIWVLKPYYIYILIQYTGWLACKACLGVSKQVFHLSGVFNLCVLRLLDHAPLDGQSAAGTV